MGNPLMSMMGRQTPLSSINMIMQMLKGGNPEAIAMSIANQNPQFAKFISENKGKTVDQLASEFGIDLNMVKQLL